MDKAADAGLIEGFYGHPWQWSQRNDMARFLATEGYRFYIYAPKSDPCLRAEWRQRHDRESSLGLGSLGSTCRRVGLQFGIGLSPLGVQDQWDSGARGALAGRLEQLCEYQPDILCLLFDDVPAKTRQLARVQAEICDFVASLLDGRRLIMCPSYYSRDPVLEQLFGPRPGDYWDQLGLLLAPRWQVFWTGEKVCSTQYSRDDLCDISARLQRKPVLWDNYPVNDGALSSRFLHLDAFRNRPAELANLTCGHAANPMNQVALSRIPLATLMQVYRLGKHYDPDQEFTEACHRLCGEPCARLLREDRDTFQNLGLDALGVEETRRLRARYAGLESDCAREIVAWLDGEYAFDPACLTG